MFNRARYVGIGVFALALVQAVPAPAQTSTVGSWGPVIPWPHVPVHLTQLPDGRILGWAAANAVDFNPAEPNYTVATVFNPRNNRIQKLDNTRHNMFCAGLATLADGRTIVAGGGASVRLTSIFNPKTLSWSASGNTIQQRWYSTNVALPNGKAFLVLGANDQPFPELWDPATNTWTEIYGPRWESILEEWHTFHAEDFEWFPWLHVAPNGRLFHSGPTPTMHYVDPFEGGTVAPLGPRINNDRLRMWGSSLMYAPGKILITGGRDLNKNPSATKEALTIDINGPVPLVAMTAPMHYARVFHYTINLPNGEVMAIGGNTVSMQFTDAGAVLPAEIWNPDTGQWRVVASLTVPRPYHSAAALLEDGRVLSTGGGLCGPCGVNHLDGQIYSPPYMFDANGAPATPPTLYPATVPDTIRPATTLRVRASPDTTAFRLIRLQSTTHGIQTDSRSMPLSITRKTTSGSTTTYTLQTPQSANIMVPGNYWLFAVNANGTPSKGIVVLAKK